MALIVSVSLKVLLQVTEQCVYMNISNISTDTIYIIFTDLIELTTMSFVAYVYSAST